MNKELFPSLLSVHDESVKRISLQEAASLDDLLRESVAKLNLPAIHPYTTTMYQMRVDADGWTSLIFLPEEITVCKWKWRYEESNLSNEDGTAAIRSVLDYLT